MLHITVKDTEVENRSGVSRATGKPFNFNQQTNIFIDLNGETRRFPLVIEEGKQPYAAGKYLLDIDKHLTVNNFGGLIVEPYARYVLLPDVSVSDVKPSGLFSGAKAA